MSEASARLVAMPIARLWPCVQSSLQPRSPAHQTTQNAAQM